MNIVFGPYLRKFILVFSNDILVYSPVYETHLEHLKATLQLLKDHELYAKLSQCTFATQSVQYLGHIITDQGASTDPDKIISMTNWPKPANIESLRGFLGLIGYYRKFIRNYGIIRKPLTDMLKKGRLNWTPAASIAFDELETAMTGPSFSYARFFYSIYCGDRC